VGVPRVSRGYSRGLVQHLGTLSDDEVEARVEGVG